MRKKVDATGKNYALLLASFIDYLESNGYRTVLLPHSARTGTEKTHNNDLPLCRAIYDKVERRGECLFIDNELTSQELRSLIGECDLFIASRFHAMVSSLAMQVPTLVIGWSHKYREVLEMFGLEKWAFGQDKLDLVYLQKRFEELASEQGAIRKKLAKALPEVKEKSHKQVDVIQKILSNG
jgi:polysaccharide pyruvyl transferase WcaK-like protein